MSNINERIIFLRQGKNLKQKEFSELIGFPRSSLSEIENGKRSPSVDIIVRISNTFEDVNTEWLLTGRGEMYKQAEKAANDPVADERARKMAELYLALSEEHQKEILAHAEKEKRLSDLTEQVKRLSERLG